MHAGYPGSRRFAFTILDDTDVATVANIAPMYRLLESLGMRTTKTVWPMACPEGSHDFAESETLEDPAYRGFVVDLQRRGFEIASHGATMESSDRERTVRAFDEFHAVFGVHPRVHANHSFNRENVYWGVDRLDDRFLRTCYRYLMGRPADWYQGHVPGSRYWWGDLCRERVTYVRNLTFNCTNTAAVNPSMPYRDPRRPLAQWWFSAADADSVTEFKRLITPKRIDALEREGGFCIVATHLGKSFVNDGQVDPETESLLRQLASRPGWFCTTGDLLDWLRQQRSDDALPAREWRQMQWRWARELVGQRLRSRILR